MGPFFTSSRGGKLAEHYRDLGAPEPYTWDRVIRYLMGEFGNYGGAPMDFYKAKATVWKNKYWHRFIRRNRGSREEHRQRLLEWEMAYHKDPPKGKRAWWLPETTVAFDNLLKHVSKGCYDYGWTTLVPPSAPHLAYKSCYSITIA